MVEKQNFFIIPGSIETMPFLCVVVGSWICVFPSRYPVVPPPQPCAFRHTSAHHRTLPSRFALAQPPVPLGGHSLAVVGKSFAVQKGGMGWR